MKRNVALLADQLRSHMTGKCLTAIVTETFVNALPFDTDSVVKSKADFAKYSQTVMESLHPESLLQNAFKDVTESQQMYLQTLSEEIKPVVEAVVARVCEEEKDSLKTNAEILKDTKLTNEEIAKLVKASKNAGTAQVSKIIQKSVVRTMKDEKEAYEREKKLKNDMMEVISGKPKEPDTSVTEPIGENEPTPPAPTTTDTQAEDITAETTADTKIDEQAEESYLNIILNPSDPRHYTSFFSKLQDVCFEALMYSSEEYDEFPVDTTTAVTLESTFKIFDTSKRSIFDDIKALKMATESVVAMSSPEEKAIKMKKISKVALISSITILTMLEVLKTMNLVKVTPSDVRTFVDNKTAVKTEVGSSDLDKLDLKVSDAVDTVKKSVALGSLGASDLFEASEQLSSIKSALEGLEVPGNQMTRKAEIMDKISNALTMAENAGHTKEGTKIPDSFDARIREKNIAALSHAFFIVASKPDVSSIKIMVKSARDQAYKFFTANVLGLDSNGKTVIQYPITLDYMDSRSNNGETIMEVAKYANMSSNKPVLVYYEDSAYSVTLETSH